MSSLNLKGIYKVYPSGVTAVTDFNLDIEDKEFIVFVGPSGCGKSTTLRMIAGLEEISAGELYIDGNLVNNIAPKDRDIAMVFQNYALYPHMTVYDNMAFGLKLRKMPKAEIDKRVKDAARILGIEMYLSRKPKALSGGQRQRVALGRAIVREPKVFLLDEPLSNLDAKLRSQMRSEITKLHNRLATTFIYVTHDQIEAMTMGTRIVVMKDGFMQQVDTPMNLYDYPVNQFVAGFIGTPQMNFYNAKLVGTKNAVYVEFNEEKVALPKEKVELIVDLDQYLNTEKEVIFGVRPEDFHDEEAWVANSKYPKIEVKVDTIEALGSESILFCKTKNMLNEEEGIKSIADDIANVIAKVDSRSNSKSGGMSTLAIDIDHCHLFDKETEVTIIARNEDEKIVVEQARTMAIELKNKKEQAEASKKLSKAEIAAEKKRAKLAKKQGNKEVVVPVINEVSPAGALETEAVVEAPVEAVEEPIEETVIAPVEAPAVNKEEKAKKETKPVKKEAKAPVAKAAKPIGTAKKPAPKKSADKKSK